MKLHIGNLPKSMTDNELTELITPFAKPLSLEIIRDQSGASKGFGFADFATDADAKAVLGGVDGREIDGQTLKLGEARPRKGAAPRA
jgi:RNA recognition motif-containing protein